MADQTRVCIVTGGGRGIGFHLAEGFLQAGFVVYVLDVLDGDPLSPGIHFIQTDVADEEQVNQAFSWVNQTHGAIHVLVNNAAVSQFRKPIAEISAQEFDRVMAVNVRGAFLCCKAFVKYNQGTDYGRIINIASTRWQQNEPHWEAYGASKGALVSLTNSLTVSLWDTPITVNVISPGWIQWSGYELLVPEDHRQHPSGRVGKPADVVNAALFLADEANDFINGANLVVDGGMTKKMIYFGDE